MIKKGTWVQVEQIVLDETQRAPQVPEDTKKTPLKAWLKGFLQADANVGEVVTIKTMTNRIESGKLVVVEPHFTHSFGKVVNELFEIDAQVKAFMKGGN